MQQRPLTEEVLDKVMNLFWGKGYFNTSIEDIIAATGLNRATLYKYGGGKDKLFIMMLKRFRQNITNHVTAPLQIKAGGIEGIKVFFSQFLELYDSINLRSRGCFLVATATEIHSHNKEVAEFIDDFYQYLKGSFRGLLLHAKNQGEVKIDIDVDKTADFLVGNLFGIMSLCRSSAPRQMFENHVFGINNFLSSLS
ncbi:TetR/AcrR family transcriptional regulator [Legionella fallonii]|uniref:TetR family transcriptional regulator-like protein n=1 Tax=Legionella fallonii LLAP-10 TaxID=1212491 RepID=A0A098G787_9GAMM|nr:TetR/AcrR family transcriptional regulator [Legionella fallonii]CEG58322.1 TetR family transcriptional regulator-like protein [Legionella fallonii LLAP-10]